MKTGVIVGYIIRVWELFKRGTRNVNFVLSLWIISLLRGDAEFDYILIVPMVVAAIVIGYVDCYLVSGQAQPRLNPYTQDFLLARVIVQRGHIYHAKGNDAMAIHEYKKANLILLNWIENATMLKHWEVEPVDTG